MKIVSEWCQHHDEAIASIGQRKNAEFVESVPSVGDAGEQPLEIVLVDALREEGDDSEEVAGVGAEFLKRRRGKRQLDRGGEALVMLRAKQTRSPHLPFPGQPVNVPFVVMRNGGKQRN